MIIYIICKKISLCGLLCYVGHLNNYSVSLVSFSFSQHSGLVNIPAYICNVHPMRLLQMEGLMHAVGKVFKANEFNDDDMVDRMNHHFTVLFLIVAMAVVTTTQYVGSPITCWCPAYFTNSHIDFTNKVADVSFHVLRRVQIK